MTTLAEARRSVYRRRVGAHETAHAAGMILWMGMIPLSIEVAPFAGGVRPDWTHHSADRETAPSYIKAILAGPLAEGVPAPSWPLFSDLTSDEAAVKGLCEHHEIDREGYEQLVAETRAAMADDDFCLLERTLAVMAESRSLITADEIRIALEVIGMTDQIPPKENE